MVPLARIERALPKEFDFESNASTNSTTGALCVSGAVSETQRISQALYRKLPARILWRRECSDWFAARICSEWIGFERPR